MQQQTLWWSRRLTALCALADSKDAATNHFSEQRMPCPMPEKLWSYPTLFRHQTCGLSIIMNCFHPFRLHYLSTHYMPCRIKLTDSFAHCSSNYFTFLGCCRLIAGFTSRSTDLYRYEMALQPSLVNWSRDIVNAHGSHVSRQSSKPILDYWSAIVIYILSSLHWFNLQYHFSIYDHAGGD